MATSLAALIAFFSTGFEGRDEAGLHLRRADGTAYVAQDDAFVLDFYAEHAGTGAGAGESADGAKAAFGVCLA